MPILYYDLDWDLLMADGYPLHDFLKLPAYQSPPAFWIDYAPEARFANADLRTIYGSAEDQVPQSRPIAQRKAQDLSAHHPKNIYRLVGLEKGDPRGDGTTMHGYTYWLYQNGKMIDSATRWVGPRDKSQGSGPQVRS